MFFNLAAGRYQVSYYYSARPGQPAATNGIALFVGTQALDSVMGTGGSGTAWGLRTVDFVTTGGALTFNAFGTSDGFGGYLDNITVSQVPEPATWGLMIAGFAMVGAVARRRRSATVAA